MYFNCFYYLVILLFVAFLSYAATGFWGLFFFILMLFIPIIGQHYNGPKKKK